MKDAIGGVFVRRIECNRSGRVVLFVTGDGPDSDSRFGLRTIPCKQVGDGKWKSFTEGTLAIRY